MKSNLVNQQDSHISSPLFHHLMKLLLMEEILHQLIGSFSHYLQGFLHPWWLAGFLPSTVSLKKHEFSTSKWHLPVLWHHLTHRFNQLNAWAPNSTKRWSIGRSIFWGGYTTRKLTGCNPQKLRGCVDVSPVPVRGYFQKNILVFGGVDLSHSRVVAIFPKQMWVADLHRFFSVSNTIFRTKNLGNCAWKLACWEHPWWILHWSYTIHNPFAYEKMWEKSSYLKTTWSIYMVTSKTNRLPDIAMSPCGN